jgi:hypothetical protein
VKLKNRYVKLRPSKEKPLLLAKEILLNCFGLENYVKAATT